MKLIFADNSELEIVSCNENYRVSDNSEFDDEITLDIGIDSELGLSQLKDQFTDEKISQIKVVYKTGQRVYENLSINHLGRTITETESTCYISFNMK